MKETEILRGLHKAKNCFAKGTPFVKGKKGVDKVDAKLTHGEAVLPVKTVRAVGRQNIARLIASTNDGKAPAQGLRRGGHYVRGLVDDAMRAGENLRAAQAPAVEAPSAVPAAQAPSAAPIAPEMTPPAPSAPPAPEAPGMFTKEGMVNRLRSLKQGVSNLMPGAGESAAGAGEAAQNVGARGEAVGRALGQEFAPVARAVNNVTGGFELPKTGAALGALGVGAEALMSGKKNAFLDDSAVSFADKARVMGRDYITHGAAAVGGTIGAAAGSGVASVPLAIGGAYLGNKAGEFLASGIDDPLQNYTPKDLKGGQPGGQHPPAGQPVAQQQPAVEGKAEGPEDILKRSLRDEMNSKNPDLAKQERIVNMLTSLRQGQIKQTQPQDNQTTEGGFRTQKEKPAWTGNGSAIGGGSLWNRDPHAWRNDKALDLSGMDATQLGNVRLKAMQEGDLSTLYALKPLLAHAQKMDELGVGRQIQMATFNRESRNQNREQRLAQLQGLYQDFDKDGKPIAGGENYKSAYTRLSGTLAHYGKDIADLSPEHLHQFKTAHDTAKAGDDFNESTFGKIVQTLQGNNPSKSDNVTDYAANRRKTGALSSSTSRGVASDIPDYKTRGGFWATPSKDVADMDDADVGDANSAEAQVAAAKSIRKNGRGG